MSGQSGSALPGDPDVDLRRYGKGVVYLKIAKHRRSTRTRAPIKMAM
jgi:hypothetical protein